MFHITQGNTQVYSPFGTYVVEQHEPAYRDQRAGYLPRPDLALEKDYSAHEDRRAA